MRVGKRKQQGQKGTTKLKEICSDCKVEYLENIYAKKKKQLKVIGKYCPADDCNYHRIDGKNKEE
jgi:hypothetical protein